MEKPHSMDVAMELVEAYDALVERAIEIVSHAPFHVCVENDESARLGFDGEQAVLKWSYYESDYYGGGCIADKSACLPANLLFLSDEDLSAFQTRARQEEDERNARVRAAQEAVARERAEARDRAEFARLCAKYEKSKR